MKPAWRSSRTETLFCNEVAELLGYNSAKATIQGMNGVIVVACVSEVEVEVLTPIVLDFFKAWVEQTSYMTRQR